MKKYVPVLTISYSLAYLTATLMAINLNPLLSCEPQHDKTNKVTVCPVKTQISLSDQSLRCPHEESLGP